MKKLLKRLNFQTAERDFDLTLPRPDILIQGELNR